MSWEQLLAIQQESRTNFNTHQRRPPEACPFDGTPLDVRADGMRNCPMGDYTWRGEPKIL